jgi:hypothetical protein
MTKAFHNSINYEVSFKCRSEGQFVLVPSECQMALKKRLKNEDTTQKLILDSDSNAHLSHDDIPPQSNSDTNEDQMMDRHRLLRQK